MGEITGTSTVINSTTTNLQLQSDIGFSNVILMVIAGILLLIFIKTYFK